MRDTPSVAATKMKRRDAMRESVIIAADMMATRCAPLIR